MHNYFCYDYFCCLPMFSAAFSPSQLPFCFQIHRSSQLLDHSNLFHILLKLSHHLPSAPLGSNVGKYKKQLATYSLHQNYHSNLDKYLPV